MESHKFVFVCGLQRSGTTMLYRSLSEHPAISKLEGTERPGNEGQHNQTVYPAAATHGRAGRFAFMSESRLTEASPLVSDANRRKLFQEWSRFWDLDRPYLMEKSPPNLIRTRFLQAMFPDSYFIVILRHPIAVSCATAKWSDTRPHSLMQHWLVAHDIFASDIPHLRRVHVVRYEDLVADPDRVLGDAFAFLGLDDVAAGREVAKGVNVDNFYADRTVRTGSNDKYFDDWNARRRTIMRSAYMDLVERYFERRVRRYGYRLRQPQRIDPPSIDLPGMTSIAAPAVL